MQIAMIGLGRMGGAMTTRLLRDGHEVVAYARHAEAIEAAAKEGAVPAKDVEDVVAKLAPPRHVWLMIPADAVTESINSLIPLLDAGDAIIDGGNSNYHDSIRRAEEVREKKGLQFVDCGTSGGIWGLEKGYCLMIGGEREVVERLHPVFTSLAPVKGWLHVGPAGAGHFVKMVHNGIEYGMLQAYAEGFELLSASRYGLDLPRIASLWNRGSVVRSWLLELAEAALEKDPDLSAIKGYVEDSGEGRWTVIEAVEHGVPATALAHSLFARFSSRQDDSFGMKLIAALRQEFGGHGVKPE
jgi:6-phosphogluconate dehydrogenase